MKETEIKKGKNFFCRHIVFIYCTKSLPRRREGRGGGIGDVVLCFFNPLDVSFSELFLFLCCLMLHTYW